MVVHAENTNTHTDTQHKKKTLPLKNHFVPRTILSPLRHQSFIFRIH